MTEKLIYHNQALASFSPEASNWLTMAVTELADYLPSLCSDDLSLVLALATGNMPAIFGFTQDLEGVDVQVGNQIFTLTEVSPQSLLFYQQHIGSLTSYPWIDDTHTFHPHPTRTSKFAPESSNPLLIYTMLQPTLSQWAKQPNDYYSRENDILDTIA